MTHSTEVIEFLEEPGRRIGIIPVGDIRDEYESVFTFIKEFNHSVKDKFEPELLRPGKSDDGKGNRIVLVPENESLPDFATITGERIYIISEIDSLTMAQRWNLVRS